MQDASEGGQLEKVESLSVITFIEETMKTLATYGKQLKSQLDINLIQTGIYIFNLTKHSFTRAEYKLLNKNLNFVPTPKVYNKNELDAD